MAKYRTIRVYPDGDVWVAKKDGTARASAVKNTKDEALRAARDIAINQGLSIIVHGRDGRIQKTVRPGETSGGGCFLTTACIKYYGLDDNCYQLQTLRNFRDNYLLKTSEGILEVDKYYEIAPQIVKHLEAYHNKTRIFREIFQQINNACLAIEDKNYEEAKRIYTSAIMQLSEYFKVY